MPKGPRRVNDIELLKHYRSMYDRQVITLDTYKKFISEKFGGNSMKVI